MARFAPNQPIATQEPTIAVDAGLPVGRHRFRLVVLDSAGRQSTPHDAIVDVQREEQPGGPIVLDPRRSGGAQVPGATARSAPRRPASRRRREKP